MYILENAIAVALVDQFSEDKKSAIIRDVVRAHLTVKADVYGRETALSAQVGTAIREMAKKKTSEVVETWRSEVEAMVETKLGGQYKQAVFTALAKAMNNIDFTGISVTFDFQRYSD